MKMLKENISILLMSCMALMLFLTASVYAQATGTPVLAPDLGYGSAVTQILALFGDYKEIPKYGIPMFAVQALMLLMKTSLGKFTGKAKLLVVSILSFASLVVTQLIAGGDFGSIIADGGIITALSVLVHQIIKQSTKENA